jgi:hypothetical protein
METQDVTFAKLGDLTFGDKFVTDMDDVFDSTEHLKFLSFAYDGMAMIAAANTDFVRGFKTGLDKNTKIIKLSH